jgi:hypothetical protein
MEWPPEFIFSRLRLLARLKLQPRELLAALRELAQEYRRLRQDGEPQRQK